MESLMSGLLANAAGKDVTFQPYLPTHHHPDSFINQEDYRRENNTPTSDDDSLSSSSAYLSDSSISNDGYSSPDDANVSFSNSYVPYYNNVNLTPPTYIRGDYYNLSPPSMSGEVTSMEANREQPSTTALSFSIDSILGSRDSLQTVDTPAQIFSSVNSPVLNGHPTDWSSFQQQRIRTHVSTPQTSLPEQLFWCHVCQEFCADIDDARAHQGTHHTNGDVCQLRRSIFNTHGYVSTHNSSGYNRLRCGICDKVVCRPFYFRHVRSHNGHICEICGFECTTHPLLRDHMNSHAGLTPHVCKVCSREFTTRQLLKSHLRSHKLNQTQCGICGKVYSSKSACVVHQRAHTGNKPFACHVTRCTKSFAQKIELQLHMKMHKKRGDL